MMTTPESLHSIYQQETGFTISLTLQRMDWWRLFASQFTADDLVLVLRHLKRGISNQERRMGCLKLTNLLFDLERLEEDIAMARAIARKPTQSARDRELARLRPVAPDQTTTTTTASAVPVAAVSAKALELLRACKASL